MTVSPVEGSAREIAFVNSVFARLNSADAGSNVTRGTGAARKFPEPKAAFPSPSSMEQEPSPVNSLVFPPLDRHCDVLRDPLTRTGRTKIVGSNPALWSRPQASLARPGPVQGVGVQSRGSILEDSDLPRRPEGQRPTGILRVRIADPPGRSRLTGILWSAGLASD
jgi:hypothetical protein